MILDNVIIKKNETVINKWKFDRYFGNVIYDLIDDTPALFKQGKMLIENSLHWQKAGAIKTKLFPQMTFDSIKNNILVLNDTGCIAFSIHNSTQEFYPMKNVPLDLSMRLNRLVFDYTSDCLLSYELHAKRLNYFDPTTNSWGEVIEERPDYAHHNRYISGKNRILYLFGGYGHHQYKADMHKVNLKTNKWEKYDLSSSILPRYLSAMGSNTEENKLYILGGKGAEMGFQELSPHNLYDLYEVDLATMTPKLLYELPEEIVKKEYVFSSNMIVDEKNECFYVLSYPNINQSSHIILQKMGLTKPWVESYGDTIKFNFHDTSSSCDLYFSPSLLKLIAVVSYSEDNINSIIDIYTIDFPPLKESDVYQKHFASTNSSSLTMLIILFITVIFIIGIMYYFAKRRRKKSFIPNENTAGKKEKISEEEIFKEGNIDPVTKYYDRSKNAIIFLGGFQVYDKYGKDLSEDFSPIIKNLLIVLLLYTLKNEKGVPSIKLAELLWFGKSDEAARNNRNVNLRKLRVLLENVENIEIIKQGNYWSVNLSDCLFFDYKEIVRLIDVIHENPHYNSDDLNHLIELLSYGDMLPNIQNEWVDQFKSEFYNSVLDVLLYILELNMNEVSIINNNKTLLKIIDIIFIFDSINEDAIAGKCRILYYLGKKALAQKVYNSFKRNYQHLLGEEYEVSLKTLLNKKILT
jgi:DNA-binding SARP family transcriptional activator